ncbi:hypothetical protein KY329_01455 [Candidatus Woesearchaeota archaeon]|nr:hypothetical protein [Candidatus Woesearchaeota archaeon]
MAWSDRKKRSIVGGFIVFIMIFSVFGIVMNYTMSDTKQKYEYNGIEFKGTKDGFAANIGGKDYTFYALPTDLEFYNIPEEAKKLLKQPMLAVTYDPDSYLAETMAEAQFIMEQQLMPKIVIQRAMTNSSGTGLKQMSCENATEKEPVLEFRESDETLIKVEGGCVIFNAVDHADVLRQEELSRYIILGVME